MANSRCSNTFGWPEAEEQILGRFLKGDSQMNPLFPGVKKMQMSIHITSPFDMGKMALARTKSGIKK